MAKFCIYRCKLNGVKPAMRVLKTKIGAIHNIEGRIAFMRKKVEFHDKKWEKNQMLSQLSLFSPVFLSVCYCYLYISVVEYTDSFFFFFFRIKRSDSFFLCKVVTPVSNCNNGLCNVIKSLIKPFFALTKK